MNKILLTMAFLLTLCGVSSAGYWQVNDCETDLVSPLNGDLCNDIAEGNVLKIYYSDPGYWANLGGKYANVVAHGARPDTGGWDFGSVIASDNTVTIQGISGKTFTSADVGKTIVIHQGDSSASILSGTISSINSSTSVETDLGASIDITVPAASPEVDNDFTTDPTISFCTDRSTGSGSISHDAADDQLVLTVTGESDTAVCEFTMISSPENGEMYTLTIVVNATESDTDNLYLRVGDTANGSANYWNDYSLHNGTNTFHISIPEAASNLYGQIIMKQSASGSAAIDSIYSNTCCRYIGWFDSTIASNNATAIKNAFDAAGNGGVVYFPSGQYDFCLNDLALSNHDVFYEMNYSNVRIYSYGALLQEHCPSANSVGIFDFARNGGNYWYGLWLQAGNISGKLVAHSWYGGIISQGSRIFHGLSDSDNNTFVDFRCHMEYSNGCLSLGGYRDSSGNRDSGTSDYNVFQGQECSRGSRCVSIVAGSWNIIMNTYGIGGMHNQLETQSDNISGQGNAILNQTLSNIGHSMGVIFGTRTGISSVTGIASCSGYGGAGDFKEENASGNYCTNWALDGVPFSIGGLGTRAENITVRNVCTDDPANAPVSHLSGSLQWAVLDKLYLDCSCYDSGNPAGTDACARFLVADGFTLQNSIVQGCNGYVNGECHGAVFSASDNINILNNIFENNGRNGLEILQGTDDFQVIGNLFRGNNTVDDSNLTGQLNIDGESTADVTGGIIKNNVFDTNSVATARPQIRLDEVSTISFCGNDFRNGGTNHLRLESTVVAAEVDFCDSPATYLAIADSGDANPGTDTTTDPAKDIMGQYRSQVLYVNCLDSDGCEYTPAESGFVSFGTVVRICNIGANSLDIVHQSPGRSELSSGANETLAVETGTGLNCITLGYNAGSGSPTSAIGTQWSELEEH